MVQERLSSKAPAPPRLRYDEAAKYVGVSRRQLERAVSARRVEHVKIGNSVSFTVEALDDFIARSTRPANQ